MNAYEEMLDILACPACKAKVELKPDHSGFKCVACHRFYRINDEIPDFNIDHATIEDGGGGDKEAVAPPL
jgi:uncharacterized protein YbaR (Trm112 family)